MVERGKPWIIEAIEARGPLTARQLFDLHEASGYRIAFQSVLRRLARLVDEGRLIRNGLLYAVASMNRSVE